MPTVSDDAVQTAQHASAEAVAGLSGPDRLALRPLHIGPHDEEFIVGDPAGGEFIAVPEIGIVILRALQRGLTMDETAVVAAAHAGAVVDVTDFAETLLELGFVSAINGRPLRDMRDRRHDGGRLGAWLACLAAPLFSPAAWTIYSLLFAGCFAALIGDPRLRPRGRDLLFLHNPVASVACMFVAGVALASMHEGAHWLAARVQGVPASFSISRRLYFLVLQTDLTGIWTLPRGRRLSPIFAGMAFDVVRLSILLIARAAIQEGAWHPPAFMARAIAALAAATVVAIVFQFFVFLRTDLYAAAVTWLGCLNLTRVTQLLLRSAVRPLSVSERAELESAGARDRRVGRWYRWVYLAGVLAAAWFFIAFFGPNIVTITRWTLSELTRRSAAQPAFWTTLLLGSLALAPVALTVFVVVRERLGGIRGADRADRRRPGRWHRPRRHAELSCGAGHRGRRAAGAADHRQCRSGRRRLFGIRRASGSTQAPAAATRFSDPAYRPAP